MQQACSARVMEHEPLYWSFHYISVDSCFYCPLMSVIHMHLHMAILNVSGRNSNLCCCLGALFTLIQKLPVLAARQTNPITQSKSGTRRDC
eukprot:364500-Chlamydomonas_euryale.AAC.25